MKKRFKVLFAVFFPITCLVLAGSLLFALLFPKENNIAYGAVSLPTKGGAIYVGESSKTTMTGSTLSGFSAYGEGGAVYVAKYGTFIGDGITIDKNSSYRGGGGVFLVDSGSLTLSSSYVSNNEASNQGGGGIYANSGSVVNVSNSYITGNKAVSGSTSTGGGIFTTGYVNMTLTDTEISGNNSLRAGGVWLSYGTTLTMRGSDHCNIRNNTATSTDTSTIANAGGVYVGTSCTFIMDGGYIGDNTCTSNPYASEIYVSELGGVLNLNSGTINGNVYARSNINLKSTFDCSKTLFTLDKGVKIVYSGSTTTPKLKIRLTDDALTALTNGTTFSILEMSGNTSVVPTTSNITVENLPDYCKLTYTKNSSGNYEVKVAFKSYTITFNATGGTVMGSSTASSDYPYNTTFGYLPSATRVGYVFLGWYSQPSGGTKYTSTDKSPFTSATTLYAHWTPQVYQLALYASSNGGTVSPGTVYYKYDTDLYSDSACTTVLSTFPIASRVASLFTGWKASGNYVSDSNGVYKTNSTYVTNLKNYVTSTAPSNGTYILSAIFSSISYTITLNHNYGSSTGASAVHVAGYIGVYSEAAHTTRLTTLTIPTKLGYTFAGYYFGNTAMTNSSGTIQSAAYNTTFNPSSTSSTQSATWTAKWTLQTNAEVVNETKGILYKTRTLTTTEAKGGGIFSSFRDAIKAAASGDILRIVGSVTEKYVQGVLIGGTEYENFSMSKNVTIYGSELNSVTLNLRGSLLCPNYTLKLGGGNTKDLSIKFLGTAGYNNIGARNLYVYDNVKVFGFVSQTSAVSATSFYLYGGVINAGGATSSSYHGLKAVEIGNGSDFNFHSGTVYGYVYMNNTSSTISYLNLFGGTIINQVSSGDISKRCGVLVPANSYFRLLTGGSFNFTLYSQGIPDIYVEAKPKNIRLHTIETDLIIGVYSYATSSSDAYFEMTTNTAFSGNGHITFMTWDNDQTYTNTNFMYYVSKIPSSSFLTSVQDYFTVLDYDDNEFLAQHGNSGWTQTAGGYYWTIDMTCFDINSDILVWDDKKKRVVRKKAKNIKYTDKLLVWNFDKGCLDFAEPLFIQKHITVPSHFEIKFSDGTIWKLGGEHRVFSLDHNEFRAIVSDSTEFGCPLGTRVINADGKVLTIVSKREVFEPLTHTNIFTNYHMNIYINGILSSTPMNNMYEIKDMKFVKKGEHCEDLNLLAGIEDKYIKGMRLKEYTDQKIKDILYFNPQFKTLKEFIDNKASYNK